MARMLEVVDTNYEGGLSLDGVYSLALVTNTLEHSASVVRGITAENVVTKELSSSFFSDIDEKIKEYENLADYQINAEMSPATALRQFVQKWPQHVVLISTNTVSWLTPMLKALDEEFELFKGRTYEILELGRLATTTAEVQLKKGKRLTDIFPQSRFNTRTGSLAKLAEMVGVTRAEFVGESIYANARARMLAEAFRRFMDRQLEA